MRKYVLAMLLALACTGAAFSQASGQDAFDFGDMPPLPPPLLDDVPNPPPLAAPAAGAQSPLVQSSGQGSLLPPPPIAPPPAGGTGLTPPPPSTGLAPVSTPDAPPMTPLPPPPITGVTPLALPADATTPAAPATATATPSIPETPRPAKISGGRVNVRAGPNTQYESIAVLTTGAPVTVLAKNGDWYKIVYPADQLASIHKNYVDADITGEIPEAGLPGIVNQDDSPVHAFYWDKSTVVGHLKKGDPVTIKQERGQWYRIASPDSARAYVFAEYVRVDGNAQVATDSAPPPANPSVDLSQGKPDATGRLKLSDDDRRAAALKEAYFKRLQEQQVREEEVAAESVTLLEKALDDLEARIRAIDSETSAQTAYPVVTTDIGSAAWAPPDPLYGGFTGWIENIGRVGGAPASFRLTKGGEIRFYLRSDRFSLNDFVGRRVWVNGNVELASGATANVLNVDQIRILTDMEIAEGMRQYAESSALVRAADIYGTPGTGVDVYGTPGMAAPASDPYAAYYGTTTTPSMPGGTYQPTPVTPTDPDQLPDVVGMGGSQPNYITGGIGEVDSDFYENPIISEIAP